VPAPPPVASDPICWVDGRLRPIGAAAVRADDSAFAEGRGCYTSVRIDAGAPRFAGHHVRRLALAARALGLPAPRPLELRRALDELARAAFGAGDGVVRLQVSRDGAGALHVVGVPRGLGDDAPAWRAISAPFPHPGAAIAGGHKVTSRLVLALAFDAALGAGAQEALLFDAAGRLVEGSRSNLVIEDAAGNLCTPPVERGAVAGVALDVVSERLPELRRRDFSRRALLRARGVAALNAVRGARPLVSLDGADLGDAGVALARRLDALLAAGWSHA
jgi:branched-subunit amino acid aminotransferase/4-amino-4-deoxychorismate lyase